jgi:hypothetical protein
LGRRQRYLTDLPHPRLNDPRLVLLRIVEPILVRERGVPLRILEPDFAQSVVDRAGDDVHVRERATEMRDAAAAGDEEGDEDDVRRAHAVFEENADRHESCRARANLPVVPGTRESRHGPFFGSEVKNRDVPAHRGERPMCWPRDVFRGCKWAV